jgi:glycosyltransferase involved in cell wall biosynthesis
MIDLQEQTRSRSIRAGHCLEAAAPVRVLELRSAEGAGGGPEKTILQGARQADPRQFAVTVCYIRRSGDLGFDIGERARALELDYTEICQSRLVDWRAYAALRRLVRTRRIDIIHSHDYKSDLLALLLARRERVAIVSTAHGWTGESWRERWIYYPADKLLLARFPCVIAVSSQIRDELIKWGCNPSRVFTVLNGIDAAAYRRDRTGRDAARRELGLGEADIAIGAMGRLSSQKRFDLLLQASARLRATHPRIRLVVAGAGPLREQLVTQARALGLGDSCRFVGHVGDARRFHNALDLFVQSSDYEGTPNVVLEAMAMETGLIATAVGGTAELIRAGRHGLLVPPGYPVALSDAIGHALTDPDATNERAREARLRVEREFSFRARAVAVEAVYASLLRQRSARRETGGGRA